MNEVGWYLFQLGCSIGLSYGVFLSLYYYGLGLYFHNPPKTINGRPVVIEKWKNVCETQERYPFYITPNNVLSSKFKVDPLNNRDNPIIDHHSIIISDTAVYGIYSPDKFALVFATICVGRSTYAFILLQILNMLISAEAGYSYGFKDPVAYYNRLPIKSLN